MKILVVAPYYASRVGGLENYARNVSARLAGRGHDVVVAAGGDGGRRRRVDTVDGIGVHRLPAWFTLSNTPVNPLWLPQLQALVRREHPDVVLAHTPVPVIADLAARAVGSLPFVLTYHNDLAKPGRAERAAIGAYWRLLGAGTLERADRIIVTSRFYADSSPHLRAYRGKTEVVPPGVDVARFHPGVDPGPVRDRFPDRQLVLFVSSLARSHAHKGLDLLLGAVAALRPEHPRLHLLVVGRGDGLAGYEERALALGLGTAVTFEGFVPDERLPAFYAAADAFVLPSTNMAEGFGMVLLEAAACGAPVIGTEVGGIPAALRAVGSPHLARPDPGSVAERLRAVLAGGRPPADAGPVPLTWDEVAARTEDVLRSALRPRVTLIHNVIAPYRLAMFDELARDVNLQVLFSQAEGRGRLWQARAEQHRFVSRRLRSVPVGPVVFNPGGWRHLRRSRFDVLITNVDPDTAPLSVTGLLLARLRRRPMVLWSEVTDEVVRSFPALVRAGNASQSAPARLLNAAVLAYRRVFLHRATTALAFSDAAQRFLVRHGMREGDVLRTYEVVPPELMPPPRRPHRRDGRTFLFVGYLTERKNVELLIDAFGDLPDPGARLLIAGSGPQEAMLRRRAGGDGRVRFLGYVADEQDKAELYSGADVLVLPTRHDCWGLVVNEAIHYGLAVVVSDAAAASEIVDEARGIVVPSGDRGALTAALVRLLREPGVLRAMQEHNRGHRDVSDVASAVTPFRAAIAGAAP